MRVLVCGGRDFFDADLLYSGLRQLSEGDTITEIAHGGAKGADSLAGRYATAHNIPCIVFPADWGKHGKSAGPIRNTDMLHRFDPDVVLACPGGKGTKHMVDLAVKEGYKVFNLDYQQEEEV